MIETKLFTMTPLLFSAVLLCVGCSGDDAEADESGGDGDGTGTGGRDSTAGDGDATGTGGDDAGGDGDGTGADDGFTITVSGGGLDLPPLSGSFILGNDDGALYFTVTMTDASGGGSITLRREGEEPWEPGSYSPELLAVNWFEEGVTCSFADGNLGGRMLTVELTQLDPVVGSFQGEATCTKDDTSVTATLTGTFDDS